jgi:hypothetical protein
MRNDPYPKTVAEVLNDQMTFRPAALTALRAFKASRPWRGSLDDRHQKFKTIHSALCEAYSLNPPPRLIFGNDHASCSGNSCFIPAMNVIILRGRLSVVSYLHEFGHARGMTERAAAAFSINLYRRIWPKLFARCIHDGHMLRAPSSPDGARS